MINTSTREKIGSQTFMSRLNNCSDTLLVLFSPAFFLQRKSPYHYERADRLNLSIIVFESDSDFFCTDWSEITSIIANEANDYKYVIAYGFSMGGYAAIRLALELDNITQLVSCYACAPHLKLSDRHSRAIAIGADIVSQAPNLVDCLMAAERLPSISLIFPVQSINDSIHVEDSFAIARGEIKTIFINTGHGVEDFLKSSCLLDSFINDIYHRRFDGFALDILASSEQIRRVSMAVPWLREFEGERQLLPTFFDEDVKDSVWHFKKSIVYFKRKEWDLFWGCAFKCAKLAGADKFWVDDYFSIYNDNILPDRFAAGMLQLGLRYSLALVDRIIKTCRYQRIIYDQVDISGLALLGGIRDCIPSELYNRYFKSEKLDELKVIFMSILSRQGNVNAIYFLSRYAFELGYYSAAQELLSCDLNSVDVAAAWEVDFLVGNVLSAVGENDEAKRMYERAGRLTTNSLPGGVS